MIESPDIISSGEPASGLLVRGIRINGYYAIVDDCSLNPSAEVEQVWFVQGGPRGAIADIGARHLQGSITLPVRVDRDNKLDPVIIALLENAQNPCQDTVLKIETNHILSQDSSNTLTDDYKAVMADSWATDNNDLITFDSCVVKSLKLIANEKQGVTLEAQIVGIIDKRTEYVAPPVAYALNKRLAWSDCDASRVESAMRTVSQLQITIDNEVQTPKFIMPLETEIEQRTDQPQFLGVKSCKWGGYFEETLRKGVETATYIHGGFMQNENLVLSFGPIKATIKVPLFKVGEQPLTQTKILKRKTEFLAQMSPQMKNPEGDLFTYS